MESAIEKHTENKSLVGYLSRHERKADGYIKRILFHLHALFLRNDLQAWSSAGAWGDKAGFRTWELGEKLHKIIKLKQGFKLV